MYQYHTVPYANLCNSHDTFFSHSHLSPAHKLISISKSFLRLLNLFGTCKLSILLATNHPFLQRKYASLKDKVLASKTCLSAYFDTNIGRNRNTPESCTKYASQL